MATIKLEVVTPTGKVLDVEADSVTAPGALGELGVLPEHRPGLVMLGGGTLQYTANGGDGDPIYIRGGVAEIRPDGVLVLADEARTSDTIDKARAEKLLADAIEATAQSEFLDDERLQSIANDRAYAEAVLKIAGN